MVRPKRQSMPGGRPIFMGAEANDAGQSMSKAAPSQAYLDKPTAVKSPGKAGLGRAAHSLGAPGASSNIEVPGDVPQSKMGKAPIAKVPGKAAIVKVGGKAPITKVPAKAPLSKAPIVKVPGKATITKTAPSPTLMKSS